MALDIGTEGALEEVLETVDKALHKHYWLNTENVVHPDLECACKKLDYCPYGQLVEVFPFSDNGVSCSLKNGAIIQFGHDCPVHYLAELHTQEEYQELVAGSIHKDIA